MLKNRLSRTRNFVKTHKTQLLTTGLLITTSVAYLQHQGITSLNEFLKEHDLFDEYYALDEDEN